MTAIIGQQATSAWIDHLRHIMGRGNRVSPRGLQSIEIVGAQTRVNMNRPIVMEPMRRLGYRFLFAEAWWILSGDDQVATIAPYSKDISRFSDDGVTFFGAYGPKVRAQLDYVVASLARDHHTRQAIINIWRENPPQTKDVPCTLSSQFILRENQLHIVDTMRSSDAWLGWPYDVFNFSMLAVYVCLELKAKHDLKVSPGTLILNMGSAHLYQPDWSAVQTIIYASKNFALRPNPPKVDSEYYHPLSLHEFNNGQELVTFLKMMADKEATGKTSFTNVHFLANQT